MHIGVIEFNVGASPLQVTPALDAAARVLVIGREASVTASPGKAYGQAGCPPFVPPNAHIVYVSLSSRACLIYVLGPLSFSLFLCPVNDSQLLTINTQLTSIDLIYHTHHSHHSTTGTQ